MGRKWFIAIAAISSLSARAQTCSWSTVDDFVYTGASSTAASGVAIVGERAFVSGTAMSAPEVGRWIVRRKLPSGTWGTVDDYASTPGQLSHADAIASDANGAVYVGGGNVGPTIVPWVVRRSLDLGTTWSIADNVGTEAAARTISAVKNGPVLVGGVNATEPGRYHWYIRTTSNSGASWGLSEDFRAGYSAAGVNAIASNGTATYAVGYEFMDYQYRWQVRRLSQGLWTLVDDWTTAPGFPFGAMPKAAAVLPSGVVLVAGTYGATPGALPSWVVRRSADSGATWSLTDQRYDCKARALVSNKYGSEVLLVGSCPYGNVDKWTVYVSRDEGLSWQLEDVFTLAPGNASIGNAGAFDERNAYVVGAAFSGGTRHWITRKRACSGPSGSLPLSTRAAEAMALLLKEVR